MAGKAEPMPLRVGMSLGGLPKVAVSLEATLHWGVTKGGQEEGCPAGRRIGQMVSCTILE